MIEKQSQMLHLFPVPVLKTNIILDNMKTIQSFIENLPYVIQTDLGTKDLLLSHNYNILEDDMMTTLKEKIYQELFAYTNDFLKIDHKNLNFYIPASWIVKILPNGHGRNHYHNLSLFTGVYYIDVDENSSPLIIHNEQNNYCQSAISYPIREWNNINSGIWSISPQKGDLILMPSNIKHSIGINNSSRDRYSLAFDVFVRGFFDRGPHGHLVIN